MNAVCTYGHSFDDHYNWIGAYYELPAGWDWETIQAYRERYGIPARMMPVASVSGVCVAWGYLLPSNYRKV